MQAAMNIPLREDQLELISDQMGKLSSHVSEGIKQQIKDYEKTKRQTEAQEALTKILKPKPFMVKMQERLAKTYDKYIVKGKFFVTLGKALKTIISQAGHWIFTLLKFLFFLAIFDPQGKFLTSILNFIISMAEMLVGIIVKLLPRVFNTVWIMVTKIIPKALIKLISSIFPMIGGMLVKWGETISKEFPFLGYIIKSIGEMFGSNGILTRFFKWLASIFPVLLGLGIAAKISIKLIEYASAIKKVAGGIKDLIVGLYDIGKGLKGTVLTMINYSKYVSFLFMEQFYKIKAMGLKKWAFEKAMIVKEFVFSKAIAIKKFIFEKALALMNPIFLIITAITVAIVLIIKFRKQIFGFFKFIGSKIYDFLKPVIDPIVKFFKGLVKGLEPLFEKLGPVLQKIGEVLSWVWDLIKNSIVAGFKYVKKSISNVMNWFLAGSTVGWTTWLTTYTEKQQQKAMALTELAKRATELKELYSELRKHGVKYKKEYGEQALKTNIMNLTSEGMDKSMARTGITKDTTELLIKKMENEIKKAEKALDDKLEKEEKAADKRNSKMIETAEKMKEIIEGSKEKSTIQTITQLKTFDSSISLVGI